MGDTIRSIVLALSLSSLTLAAQAVELPYKSEASRSIAAKQSVYTEVRISKKGKVDVKSAFANGTQRDGNTFYALTKFKGSDGKLLAVVFQQKEVSGAYGFDPRKMKAHESFKIGSDKAALITTITSEFGTRDEFADAELGADVLSAIKAIEKNGDYLMLTPALE